MMTVRSHTELLSEVSHIPPEVEFGKKVPKFWKEGSGNK